MKRKVVQDEEEEAEEKVEKEEVDHPSCVCLHTVVGMQKETA